MSTSSIKNLSMILMTGKKLKTKKNYLYKHLEVLFFCSIPVFFIFFVIETIILHVTFGGDDMSWFKIIKNVLEAIVLVHELLEIITKIIDYLNQHKNNQQLILFNQQLSQLRHLRWYCQVTTNQQLILATVSWYKTYTKNQKISKNRKKNNWFGDETIV